MTVDGIEPIVRGAIRKRLRNADAEHAILDVTPGGPPNTLLVHVNSGGNAIAVEDALTDAGYLVDSRPAGHGVVLGVALRSFVFASLRYAQNMREAGLEVTVEQIAPGQTRVSGREPGAEAESGQENPTTPADADPVAEVAWATIAEVPDDVMRITDAGRNHWWRDPLDPSVWFTEWPEDGGWTPVEVDRERPFTPWLERS